MRRKAVRRILIACVMGITIFCTIGMSVPTRTSVLAQGGPIEVGAAVSIGITLVNEIKDAIRSYGTAIAYVKAKTDGPDSDDQAVDYEFDRDMGTDYSLDAKTDLVTGTNNVDDKEETPYSPGEDHCACIELHFNHTGGVWKPDPSDCGRCPDDQKKEFYGWVAAEPEDDPTVNNQKTFAAAAAAFSADGKTVDFCYRTSVATTPGGGTEYEDVEKVDCSPLPEFALQQGAVFLASVDRFTFEPMGGDQVIIRPLFESTIDLFHSYLQEGSNLLILPLSRGHDEGVQELKRDIYENRINGTSWVLSEEPAELADLTIVGAALHFSELQVMRAGRSNFELLEQYFSSSSAVTIVAPEHAQDGYEPQVAFRAKVNSGQNITQIIGRSYVIPVNGDPSEPVEDDPLIGLVFGVSGDINESVSIAINTDGHFVRDIANKAWDAVSTDAVSTTVEFKIPELNFHHESPSSLSDIAVASPSPVGGIIEFPQLEEPGAFAPDSSGHAQGASTSIIAGAIAGAILLISAAWYIRRRRTKATS